MCNSDDVTILDILGGYFGQMSMSGRVRGVTLKCGKCFTSLHLNVKKHPFMTKLGLVTGDYKVGPGSSYKWGDNLYK